MNTHPLLKAIVCAAKIKEKLGWQPKVRFKELVKMMVDSDLHKIAGEFVHNKVHLTVA